MIETFATILAPRELGVALPPLGDPRVIVVGDSGVLRWKASAVFPGTRPSAKMVRLGLRIAAAVGFGVTRIREQGSGDAEFRSLLAEAGVARGPIALRSGTGGLHRKLIIAVHDKSGTPVAYVKVGPDDGAASLVLNEVRVVKSLPDDVGPRLLAVGTLLGAKAAVFSALHGRAVPTDTMPPNGAMELLHRLAGSRREPASAHPWVRALGERNPNEVAQLAEALGDRSLPVGLSHGDYAPWNLVHTKCGTRAYDWEWGLVEGLPYVDAVHYSLQVQRLIKRVRSDEAARRSAALMTTCLELRELESWGLLGLTGLAMSERALMEEDHDAARWWRGVLEQALRATGKPR